MQKSPHGSLLTHEQEPPRAQPGGSGRQENPSGSPPTSEALRWQYSVLLSHARKPHENAPAGTGQPPFALTSTPAAWATHSLSWMIPSQPHTGAKISGQAVGLLRQVPASSAVPQLLRPKSQNSEALQASPAKPPHERPLPPSPSRGPPPLPRSNRQPPSIIASTRNRVIAAIRSNSRAIVRCGNSRAFRGGILRKLSAVCGELEFAILARVRVSIVGALVMCGACSFPDLVRPDGDDDAGPPAEVKITRRDGVLTDDLVAFQDGDGPWTVLAPTGMAYLAKPTGSRFGVMAECHYETAYAYVQLVYRTVEDGTDVVLDGCQRVGPVTHKLTLGITNVPAEDRVVITATSLAQVLFTNADGGAPISLDLELAPEKYDILIASRHTADRRLVRMTRGPTIDLQQDQALNFDMNASAMAVTYPLAVSGGEPTSVTISGTFRIPNRTVQSFYGGVTPNGAYEAPPPSFFRPDELWSLSIRSGDQSVTIRDHTPGAVDVTFPPNVFAVNAASLLEAPYLRPSIDFGTAPPTQLLYRYDFTFQSDDPFRFWTVAMSGRWVGDAGAFTYTLPDFSALPGFDMNLVLAPRTRLYWTAARSDATAVETTDGAITYGANESGILGKYCGDGQKDPEETCDTGGESITCDADCTAPECGDSYVNASANEACDPPDLVTCDAACAVIE